MRLSRLFGLFATAAVISAVASVSAQPGKLPGVKVAPQVKPPADPGKLPPATPPKNPIDPKGKILPPGTGPGVPGTGGPPGTGGTPPLLKGDPGNWPKEINGKNLETIVQEIRSNPDPGVREAAVRALPYFGPRARELGFPNLLYAQKSDPDINIKIAALDVLPTVCMAMGYLNTPDKIYEDGLNAVINLMDSEFYPLRLDAASSVTAFGLYAKVVQPRVVTKLITQTRATSSWQLRRAAAGALALFGQGMPAAEGVRPDPDTATVTSLLDILKADNCGAVRREAVNSLLALGPVANGQTKTWRADLERVVRQEKDKSVLLWVRTCIVRNDPAGPKANATHMDAIAEVLNAKEDGGRLEACQALGVLAEDAIGKLRELLTVAQNEKVPAVQAAAISALATMKSQAAAVQPILQGIVGNPATNMDVRKVASEAIVAVNKKDPPPLMPKKN